MTATIDFKVTSAQHEADILTAAKVVRERLGEADICIVLGSGLNGFADTAFGDDLKTLSYSEIPHIPQTAVAGHYGKLFYGTLHGKRCLCFAGRFHSYEGYPGHVVSFLPRLAAAVGCKLYMLTNAAGGAGPTMVPGCGMAMIDQCQNVHWAPLRDTAGTRAFPAKFTSEQGVYSQRLIKMAGDIAKEIDFPFYEGVYQWNSGPTYETPAEIRAYRALGVSSFGMSSVPEAAAAREAGLEVFGLSLITNMAAGLGHEELTHEEVSEVAGRAGAGVSHIVSEIVRRVELPTEKVAPVPAPETVDEVTARMAKESPMVLPRFEFPTRETVQADAAKLAALDAAATALVVLPGSLAAAGLTLVAEGPLVTELAGYAAPRPLTRAGYVARVSAATTPAGAHVFAVHLPEGAAYPEGLAFHESIPAVLAAAAAGARLVHDVVPAQRTTDAAAPADEVVAVRDHVNFVRDAVSPALPRVFAGAAATPAAEGAVLAVYPGPVGPTNWTRNFYASIGATIVTHAGAAPLVHARALGIPTTATALVGAPVAQAVAQAIDVAVAAAPAAAPAMEAAFPTPAHTKYHLFNASLGTVEETEAAVAAAKAELGDKLAAANVEKVLVAADTQAVRAAVAAAFGEISEAGATGIAVAGADTLVAFVPTYSSGVAAAAAQRPIRAAIALGARAAVFIAEAAVAAADVIQAADHINFTGESSLRGVNVNEWGVRFPDCTSVYAPADVAGAERGVIGWALANRASLTEAETAFMMGEHFNTRAVVTDGALLGVLAARHASMKITCLVGADVAKVAAAGVEALKAF